METKLAIAIALPLWLLVVGVVVYFAYLRPKGVVA